MGELDDAVLKLRRAHEELLRLRPAVERAAPPAGEPNTEHDWAAGEVLAHCAEMLPYWLGEIERILGGGPEPVPFGRVATDPVRTLTVDRDRTLPVGTLYERIAAGVERAAGRLPSLDAAAVARRGLHPRRGEMTVTEVAERFMADHLEEHAEQLAATIEGSATS